MTDAAVPETSAADPAVGEETPAVKRGTDWWGELKGIFWLLLVVLGFHSFIAKPFYIPSESMLPGLEVGDRLVVTKYAYGWSFVSPTIPNPVAIFRSVVLREPEQSWTVGLPFIHGRLLGRLPARGDVVIVTPPGTQNDYIKRVIGLPGDTIAVHDGVVILNGRPLQRGALHYVDLPEYGGVLAPDGTETCDSGGYNQDVRRRAADGSWTCHLPVVTETLPGGRRYDTVELGPSQGDEYGPVTVAPDHVFLMGDNRDRSADSRFQLSQQGLGGAVPYENIGGRAEFITFSLDGSTTWNPLTWFTSFRGGRAGTSLHATQAR
ncbi:signal peptidase I [Sphingomonas sp.]|uniref:signal peptidase I n=1 Tax=Sphingomonas sp. TaxID=28214 RepID=UPI003CC61398